MVNFLHLMFCIANRTIQSQSCSNQALDKLFILHADQNCSSTVRMVGSYAGLFASISAGGFSTLGSLHGGADQQWKCSKKFRMVATPISIWQSKDKEDPFRLMGFGHTASIEL
jgi:citrate synthase